MGNAIDRILSFLKHDFFPNLAYYLLQIFLIVLMVLLFAGINIVVRLITDPLCIKILRMKENRRGPAFVGLAITVVICAILLVFAYNSFPQLQPTVVGWTGKQVKNVLSWDWGEKAQKIDKIKDVLPGTATGQPGPPKKPAGGPPPLAPAPAVPAPGSSPTSPSGP